MTQPGPGETEIFQNNGHEAELWKTCNGKGENLKRISRGHTLPPTPPEDSQSSPYYY